MRDTLERIEDGVVRWLTVGPDEFSELPGHPLTDVSADRVEDYKDSRRVGLGPIVTVGRGHAVLDGRHRVAATKALGRRVEVLNISERAYERLAGDGGRPARSLEQIANHVIECCRAGRGILDP